MNTVVWAKMPIFLSKSVLNFKEKLKIVVGLDPAGPEYNPPTQNRKLVQTDAAFVDVIHSNMGVLGDSSVDGHADFYPNGGVSQPGCLIADTGIPAGDITYVGKFRFTFLIFFEIL